MLPVCRLQITIGIVVCFLLHARCADEYTDQNRPYEFGFKIDGQQHRHEKKDKDGIIMGEFGFITADDVYHVTVYATDKEGRFKILSMKNIHLKSSQTSPSRDGYSRALQPSATPNQPEKPPSQPQQIPAIATRNSFEPVSLEPPVKSCSSCSIPTTSTQAPPPAPPSYNQDDYNNPIQAGQSPPTNQRGVPNSPNNSPQYTLSNAPSYPQQQGAQPVYPGQIENNPGSQQPYANNQESGFGSQGPNAQAQPQSNPNSLGKALSNPSNPAQTGLSEREPKQYSGPPQDFGTNTGIPQSQNIAQGQISSQEPNYPQGPDFPQTQNYPQGQNFPQTPNYPQGQDFPQTQNFPQGQNFPQTQNYPQGQTFPQSQNYPQGPNFSAGQNNPQGQNFPQTQNYPQGSNEATGTAPNKPTLVSAQMQIVDKNTDINRLSPGETAGLPPGLSKHDMVQLLYTFNYTLSFQGHFEEGYSNGVKKGYYFVTGRDGVKRRIDYVADDTGFHPKVSSEVLDVLSDDVPKPETEKDAKYGLKGYEFKWLYYPVDS